MATALYDMSVASYLQTLDSIDGVLEKGAEYARENGIELGELVETRLREDMHPLRFQLISVAHHSLGAIRGIQAGLFQPPPSMPDLDYGGLQALVRNAAEDLRGLDREEIDALAGRDVLFKLSSMEIPFTAENFVLSFSLPNFYFHATTAYGILRMKGVPLGKLDYLGAMRASMG